MTSRPAATSRPLTVVGLMLALFMGAMEMTVVSTAMPTVISDLGGIDLYAWVFTGYVLASTITVPIYGKLADLYGRKPVMLFGIAVFLLGSVASGQARSMGVLIAFRALQGFGAGAMQPIALTIVGDIFSLEERARMQGLFGAVWGVAGLSGPLLGGLIVKVLSWRWVFYVNVPFGILSAGLLVLALHEKVERHDHKLDVLGAAVLTAGLLVLLGATRGASGVVGYPLAVLLLVAFVRIELSAKEPLLPVDLFRRRLMAVSSAGGALIGGAMLAMVTYLPLFVQGVLGGSPTEAGAAITPMVIAWPVASALGGRLLPRVGFRPLVLGGFFIAAGSAVALAALVSPTATSSVLRLSTAGFGLGMGFANTALIIGVQTSVEWRQRGVATASTMFFRTIGGALAVGGTGRMLAVGLAAASAPPEAAAKLLGPEHGRGLDPALVAGLSGALASSLGAIFWVVAALAVGAFAVSLLFPEVRPAARSAANAA